MSDHPQPEVGSVGWLDITVADADPLRDFYAAVVGWTAHGVSMGGGSYEDYAMVSADGAPRAGVCHARGSNADLPPVWIPYFVVADIAAAVQTATARGAQIVSDRRGGDGPGFVVVRVPAGAVFALWGAD